MVREQKMYLLFLLFWILLNGKLNLEIFLFGIVISAAIYWFICRYMDYSVKKDIMLIKSTGILFWFLIVLIREIFWANWNVLKLVYSVKYEPEPAIVYFTADFKTGLAKVLLANSITLTPGTISVSVEGDRYCVHCLDKTFSEGIESSDFVRILHRLEANW